MLGDLNPQGVPGAGHRRAGDASVEALEGDGRAAPRNSKPLDHPGHRADRGEVLAASRDQEDAFLLADLEGEARVMPGKTTESSVGIRVSVSMPVSLCPCVAQQIYGYSSQQLWYISDRSHLRH